MKKKLVIETPQNFDYKRTVWSHGWYQLLPFEFNEESWVLGTVINCPHPVFVSINDIGKSLQIEFDAEISGESETKILNDIRHIFRFDDNLSEFYKLTKKEKHLSWVAKQNAGRMLRSVTVFEDLVKTVCTTNCSWALTKIMVTNLVNKLGEVSARGKKSFPTAEAMAKMPIEFYKEEIRAGYRASYFKELAEKIADGDLDVEGWLKSDLPTKQLKKEMKKVKGVGDYAAENLLKLIGRYDGLALDSFLRSEFYKKYNQGNACEDKQIEENYEKFGEWRGLVMWLDMTEKWL
jgi:N-glycosylase/DNA lyase